MIKQRPILFSGPMVRAILDDTKTQTRRLVKNVPQFVGDEHNSAAGHAGEYVSQLPCPHGQPGDRLWVKETHSAHGAFGDSGRVVYRADLGDDAAEPHGLHWKPSIFCTRAASRITLEITSVRVERLNDCSEQDAKAEGIKAASSDAEYWTNYLFKTSHPKRDEAITDKAHRILAFRDPRESYASLWESIHGPGSWQANPWVWVIKFRREEFNL